MSKVPDDLDLTELLPCIVRLARDAGQAILDIYREIDAAFEYKRDKSPLTKADLVSHRLIMAGLTSLSPELPVLSEESQGILFERRCAWRCFWLVDPLDGTKEFLQRNGEFTVNIALVATNRPVLGVVYAPAIDRLYYAAKGAGAWKRDREKLSRIRVAADRRGCVRIVISRSHSAGEKSLDCFAKGADRCEFVSMGSSLKFCLIAEGAADIYPRLGPTMEWDIAAAHCIIEEAGGSVTELGGNAMTYNKRVLLNPSFIARGLR